MLRNKVTFPLANFNQNFIVALAPKRNIYFELSATLFFRVKMVDAQAHTL